MSENKIKFPVKLASNNPQSFGIVDATEISGHRSVDTLSDLYDISDPMLSILKDGSDAVGQEWFVVSEDCKYRLDNWENRKSIAGWTKLPKQELINGKQSISEKDQPSGYAGLDSNGKLPIEKTYGTTATVVDVETYESLPAIGLSGVIYYVSNTGSQYKWSGSAYVDITDGADNAKKNETSIFDCSNGTSTKYYSSLSNAINVVPPEYRTSNRIISYLSTESSPTSAVNYQYHGIDSTTWTDLTKWERIPNQTDLAEMRSDLIKLDEKPDLLNVLEDGFYICDSDGNVLIRLDVLDTKSEIGNSLTASIKTLIDTKLNEGVSVVEANAIGENLNTLISDIANDGGLQETIEEGFFICNDKKEVIAKYIDGKWDFSGAAFSTINNGFICKRGNVSTGQTWVLANNAVKNGKRKSFSGNLIGAFNSIIIGHSDGGTSDTSYVVIDNTNITSYIQNVAQAPIAHGINIANNLQVSIVQENGHSAKIKITSSGYTSGEKTITWIGSNGNIYLTSNSDFSDASFGWCCTKLNNGIWLFGDSYFSLADTARWTSYLIANGFTNLMLDGYGGRDSSAAYSSVINLLKIATPRKIVWCLGMNDPDTKNAVNVSWHTNLENLKAICAVNNIELILATIPTAVGRYTEGSGTTSMQINKFKNAIVRASGYRYIDFDKAVGADENTGAWLNDGLVNDFLEDRINGIIHTRIHPTSFGAIALYHRAIADVPELMM